MPRLVNRTPFLDEPSDVIIQRERIRIRANQIIAWATLTLRRVEAFNPAARPFPVILDTGLAHTFAIQEQHLVQWAGVNPNDLRIVGSARDRGLRVTLRAANMWVHCNEPGSRDQLASDPPFFVQAKHGIAVYPAGDFPRLPILGLKAIADNKLILKVDGRRREATLRTALKWWPFG